MPNETKTQRILWLMDNISIHFVEKVLKFPNGKARNQFLRLSKGKQSTQRHFILKVKVTELAEKVN